MWLGNWLAWHDPNGLTGQIKPQSITLNMGTPLHLTKLVLKFVILTTDWGLLTLLQLSPDITCLCKQCRSRSVCLWGNQLIWICTVCHLVSEFIPTICIKDSYWLRIISGACHLIYSAWQRLRNTGWVKNSVYPGNAASDCGLHCLLRHVNPNVCYDFQVCLQCFCFFFPLIICEKHPYGLVVSTSPFWS